MNHLLINSVYLLSSMLFIFGLKFLSSPKTAKKGNLLSGIGMLIAVLITLIDKNILSYQWIFISILIGTVIGIFSAKKIAMTKMPEMVALLNGFGGASSLFVALWAFFNEKSVSYVTLSILFITLLIGAVTFTGSLIAWGKLSETIPGKPYLFKGQRIFNSLLFLLVLTLGVLFIFSPIPLYLYSLVAVSILLGLFLVIPIGGADMPVVISLLNSYSGLAACAAGFVIENSILIIAGSLVGASGIILTSIMCKAMNRSLINVLFSGFGKPSSSKDEEAGEVQSISPQDAYYVLEAAKQVLIVPGYGMAVAQAQHACRELSDLLEGNEIEIKYAIHPVAGRMPGHMNVLLAEADISYDHFIEMEEANKIMPQVDVCLVIGANDVVNPSARDDESSPIYGMPIIEADLAKNVFVLKRSMSSGFAGIQNPLFFKENTKMIFGDAKKTLELIIEEF